MPKNANGHTHGKSNLPQKTCVTCARPFNWRRKWKNCWHAVQYCSERCRRHRKQAPQVDQQSQVS
ncbi:MULTISPECIES: DUF2256 domain-containing protein [unclassified Thalassospira]|uniref:DUF2256 domain-containing protein n=1 Tax=unclassified Thalassospira TaxID=2648997 RepID=UPI000EBCC7AF|nr:MULTISPECIES: DUF2256 domain-containing protein [unclassified Thalassospira]HAI29514.1 DUF2256 domain-containing protein [Thalassospira sp.]